MWWLERVMQVIADASLGPSDQILSFGNFAAQIVSDTPHSMSAVYPVRGGGSAAPLNQNQVARRDPN